MTTSSHCLKRLLLAILPDGLLLQVKKIHYAHLLRSFSEDEEVDLKAIRLLLTPGDCVAGIGANIGIYTKHLSRLVGNTGRVYSVEPIPTTFEILCSNRWKLGLENVEPINCAASDRLGTLMMEIPCYESRGENFHRARVIDDGATSSFRQVIVNSTTVDSLLSELRHPISFIKCDVGGYDLQCLRGAANIIKKSKPGRLIEIWQDEDD